MLAVHHLEQAGELEFSRVEEKAALVQTFLSSMKHITFDKGDPRKEAIRRKRSDDFFKALTQAGITEDEFMVLLGANSEELLPEYKKKQRIIFEIGQRYEVSKEEEEGEDIYDLDKAKYWLIRIEEQVARSSTIEDKIELLKLYQISELRDEKKEEDLSQELEIQGMEGSIEDLRIIANYFWKKDDKERADIWLQKMEKALFVSHNMDDKLEAADWYVGGRGVIPKNLDKAHSLYTEGLQSREGQDKVRIEGILAKIEAGGYG